MYVPGKRQIRVYGARTFKYAGRIKGLSNSYIDVLDVYH